MDPLTNIWQIALALVVIVAVVYGLGLLAKRMQGIQTLGAKGDKMIKIVESTYLGPKERLVLVDVSGQQVLLAINAQSISKISDIRSTQFSSVLDECEQKI